MHKLKEKLMEELYEFEEKAKKMPSGKLSTSELEKVYKLSDTVKNLGKIEMMEESEYSEEGANSYANRRGSTYVRGYYRGGRGGYSRDGGYSEEGGSSYRGGQGGEQGGGRGGNQGGGRGGYSREGGYSRDGAKERMIEQMEEMMEMADGEEERRAIRQCISKIENA